MRFAFTEEQEALRAGARRFLQAHSPPAAVRLAMRSDSGYDPMLWRRIGRELGWTSLIVPEAYGGAGLGWVELVAVLEEMGRALACAPFFSTVCLATSALLLGGSEEQKREHLPGIAAGETIATLAPEPGVTARPDGDHVVLDGETTHVVDGHVADLVIAAAGSALFLVPGRALTRRPLSTMDPTRRLASLRFDGVRVDRSARLRDVLAPTLQLACVGLAAEQVGGADRCLELSVEHAKARTQFGRPIGSFQAIKHRLADLLLEVESARSACYGAAWAAAAGDGELPLAAATAKAVCSEAFFRCAAETIQIHGGIGFTWEHDAHIYFKRARASEAFLGPPAQHRERVALALGL